jgi:hypothetical protein
MVAFTSTGEEAYLGKIFYAEGYKYQLKQNSLAETNLRPKFLINTEFIGLSVDGVLLVRSGYAWDGASGIALDTPSAIYASVFHDALYQLIRLKYLPAECKDEADRVYKRLCLDGGMSHARAQSHFIALKIGGKDATLPKSQPKLQVAPRFSASLNNGLV